ncbi:cobalamin binding intrinsic factor-like [Pogoniulus pusillus]|uniref:cobalamin binding intrinsic factor-like n=1 Tax=Pogoniulus pusillus TaxID=488313 RepID=UPI0030B951E4
MLRVAVTIGVLLALLGGTAMRGCTPLLVCEPQDLISRMLRKIQRSTKKHPDPSFLLAMNLAGDNKSHIHDWLLQHIKEEAVEKAHDMTSGQVALHVLALISSCQDPRDVEAKGKTINLVSILQEKTDEEVVSMEIKGVPKTTLFSVSLDALALCLVQAGGYRTASVALAKRVLESNKTICVDTRAMAVQALVCTSSKTGPGDVQDLLNKTVSAVANDFLDEQEKNGGMIGNIYSMGLALQALEISSKFRAPRVWNCAQAFAVVHRHDYQQPMPIAQVLPALLGKSYLDAGSMPCPPGAGMCPLIPGPRLDAGGVHRACNASSITVHYRITNRLQGKHFNHSITVKVPAGSKLLKVLKVAEKMEPDIFSFKTKEYSQGPMVVSIHGLDADPKDRTYWQFLSGKDALKEGVGTYKPHDMEHIMANFTTY